VSCEGLPGGPAMAFRLNKNDTGLLRSLAEYRVLTVGQVAVLIGRTIRSARHRLAELDDADLIAIDRYAYGGGRGRPEGIVSLTPQGLQALREMKSGDAAIPPGGVGAVQVRQLGHDLLVNWVRLHLRHAALVIPRLRIHFEVPAYALVKLRDERSGNGRANSAGQTDFGLIPDGALSITDKEIRKTLLFFLEVDMGTESLTSASPETCSVLQKIQAYQSLFRSGAYKRYEEAWDCHLTGYPRPFRDKHVCTPGRTLPSRATGPALELRLADRPRSSN